MRYLKWLNLIPLIMFFIVDQLRGTLISRYLLIIIVALGVMNMFLAKSMKEYVISSLMLVAYGSGNGSLHVLLLLFCQC